MFGRNPGAPSAPTPVQGVPAERMKMMRPLNYAAGILAVAATLAFAAVGSALAQANTTFTASLTGAAHVPPVETTATGTGTFTYNPSTMTLTWNITYTGLSGPVVRATLSGPAAAGANGNPIMSLGNNLATPINGSAVLSASQAAQLLAGQWYVDIRTSQNRSGEIRGQILPN
jgi:hypothetical protein